MSSILIVEDEADIAATLAYNLGKEGFVVHSAATGQKALEIVASDTSIDIVMLDLMLPDMSGLDVCRQLRAIPKMSKVPVVMLTAKGEEIDRVVGFEVGADDYVVKPFSVRELTLRLKAILRRAQTDEPVGVPSRFGILRVDEEGHRTWVEDTEVRLTALEFRLLTTFLSRRGRVQTRDGLLNDVWGIDADVTTRTVDTHVKRLREKLGQAGEYVETLRGVGYRWKSKPTDPSME